LIELAFYKGKSKKSIGNMLFTKFIKLWSRFQYSHVELVIKPTPDPTTWTWISSTGDGPRGTTIEFNPDNWDFIELEYFNVLDAVDFFEEQYGMGYDWWGIILSQLFKTQLDNRQKWFCSELVYAGLVEGRYFEGADADLNPANVSPKNLYKMVT